MSYKKSAKRITALLFCMIFMLVIGVLILLYLAVYTDSNRVGYFFGIVSAIGYFVWILIPNIISMYRQKLYINDCIAFDNLNNCTQINFDEIIEINYKGTKFFPLSEMIIIKSLKDSIYVDYNFKDYLNIWQEIISLCQERNLNINIDSKIIKRLNP